MESTPSIIISLMRISSPLLAASLLAIGVQTKFAMILPKKVVIEARDIAGPTLEGSSIFFKRFTSPIRVPIIPQAGNWAARVLK
jgi:hypothetical protein